jgi:hypothetical protein
MGRFEHSWDLQRGTWRFPGTRALRSGIIAHRVFVGTHLVQCGLRSRVLWHGVMPTFTLVMGNGRILGECGERAGRVAWRNEGRI